MQPHRFATYERNWTGDESLFRRYHGWWSRFAHPDPSDSSYSMTDPQSFNRYAYTQNDPVNFVDPTGLDGVWVTDPATGQPYFISGLTAGVTIIGGLNGFAGFGGGGGAGHHDALEELGIDEGIGGGSVDPQNPAPTPTPCPGSIPEGIGKQILAIASQENIDPTLLSVTMRHESSFGTNMTPNERWEGRGRNRTLVGWDVGPMQLGTNVWGKAPFTDGLSNPFGTIAMNPSTHQYDSFNGNFGENVTLAARAFGMDILPRSHGKDWLHRNADAAGMYRGPGDYQGRYNQYIQEAPSDRRQLNCIAGRP